MAGGEALREARQILTRVRLFFYGRMDLANNVTRDAVNLPVLSDFKDWIYS